jgi:cob(I)alamin adenosyltransferase
MSIRLSKIYTKTGDKGTTGLISGDRVAKDHVRIQAIGDVDEANSTLGLAILHADGDESIRKVLRHIQNDLFDLGADMALPMSADKPNVLRIIESQVLYLEGQIDNFNSHLKPLDSFVLPGGSALSAALHQARAVVRRSERSLVKLKEKEDINPFAVQYINRLSDLLFVLSRCANDNGNSDILWTPGANRDSG